MREIRTSSLMSGDGKRDGPTVSSRAYPRLYRRLHWPAGDEIAGVTQCSTGFSTLSSLSVEDAQGDAT